MADVKKTAEERVNPMRYTDEDGTEYIFDFNRDSVRFAEARGFKVEDFLSFLQLKAHDFFFYACRMHHKNLAKNKTDELFERIGGFDDAEWNRLITLYQQAQMSNVFVDKEDIEKNRRGKVELD